MNNKFSSDLFVQFSLWEDKVNAVLRTKTGIHGVTETWLLKTKCFHKTLQKLT